MSNRFLLAVALAILHGAACAAAPAESPSDFAFALPIEQMDGEAFFRLSIPQQVYESTAFADLRDVRVFNDEGEVVPHAFVSPAPRTRKTAPVVLPFFPLHGPRDANPDELDLKLESNGRKVSLRVTQRNAKPGNYLLGYLVDSSHYEDKLGGLRFDWREAPAGFLGSLRIDASDDLKNWINVVDRAPLISLRHGSHHVLQKTVTIPPQRLKYLRLTWPADSRDLRLTRVQGLPPDQFDQAMHGWKDVTATPDPDKRGDYLADLGGRFPVDRLVLRLPQENAIAVTHIFSRDLPSDEWKPVTRAVVYRLRQGGRDNISPEFPVSPNARRYWLLRVDTTGGGIGKGAIEMRAGWTVRDIVFAARGKGPFILAVGNAKAQPNAMPVQTLVPGWGSKTAPAIGQATTGSVQTLAGLRALSRIDFKTLGLWASLLAGVALLGWMSWKLSRQMAMKPQENRGT
jgi:hypothetical protein